VGLLRAADLDRLRSAPFTYAEVGATQDDELPAGCAHGRREAVVGSGRAAFDRAVAAMFDWRMQKGVGLRVRASGPPTEPGTVVVLTAGLRRFGYDIPCRVVWARTDGDEQGFAYGSLPGHPESGEESFVVTIDEDDVVEFTVTAFSRPATWLSRLGGPATKVVQRRVTWRYLEAVDR